MKNYTTIPNYLSIKLNSADLYRYTCLTFTPQKQGYTDSTFKQIAEYINKENPESESTVKKFVQRLKTNDIIRIDEVWIGDKRRNKYYIIKPDSNFRIIKKELLELNLEIELKGFMIQLFTIALNNSYEVNYSINEIVKLIKISKPTAIKYFNELISKNLIIKTEKGYLLSNEYFSTGNKKKNQIIDIYKSVQGCDHLTNRFFKTKWETINNPKKYWNSVVAGIAGKKIDISVETSFIMI